MAAIFLSLIVLILLLSHHHVHGVSKFRIAFITNYKYMSSGYFEISLNKMKYMGLEL